jgi:hypothetical protein
MTRWRFLLILALPLVFSGFNARSETLLIDQRNPYLGYGYGLSSWPTMTADLNTAFGGPGNVTVSGATLDNIPNLMSYDRLWITARQPGDPGLSAAEQTALSAYIAAGHRVVLTGENANWASWNNSILAPVGGSYSGSDTSATLTRVVLNSITAGVPTLNTIFDGIAVGGTSLFNQNVVTLWEPQQNVLSILSVNVQDDNRNVTFDGNVATWLAAASTSVPEPSSVVIVCGSLLAGMGWIRHRRRK